MNFTGQLQNSLCGGGLAGIHMGEDSDVPVVA
jgi:hypothetical protein